MTTHHPRQFPIVLITGTPGTGKTLHSSLLHADLEASETPMVHLNIGDIVKEKGFHEGFDEEWQSYTVDEDRLLDYLEEVVNPQDGPASTGTPRDTWAGGARAAALMSGFIFDHHDPGLFPERWIDLVVVLTCNNGILHERLTERNYPENKLTENITAEIMMTCLTEARESYDENIIVELKSDDGETDENVGRIVSWIESWRKDRLEGKHDEE